MAYLTRDEIERQAQAALRRGVSPQAVEQRKRALLSQSQNTPVKPQPQQSGGIRGLVKGAIKEYTRPGVDLARAGAGAVGLTGAAALAGGGKLYENITGNKTNVDETGIKLANKVAGNVLTQRQREVADPNKTGLKAEADRALEGIKLGGGLTRYIPLAGGTAANAATAGGRILQSGGVNAVLGAGTSLYNTKGGVENLGDIAAETLTGGVMGFGTGAGMQAIGEGLKYGGQRIKRGGRKNTEIKTGVTGSELSKDPTFVKDREAIREIAAKIGIDDTLTPEQQAQKLMDGLENYQKEIGSMLKDASPVDQDDLLNNFSKRLLDTEFDDATPSQQRFLNNLLKRMSETKGDAQKVYSLKSKLRGELSNAFKAIDRGTTPTTKDQAKMALYDALKDSLDTVDDNIRQLNYEEKLLYDLADEIVGNVQKDAPVRLGLPTGQFGRTSIGVDLPFTGGQLKAGGARVRNAVSGGGGGMFRNIVGGIGSTADVAGRALTNPSLQGMATVATNTPRRVQPSGVLGLQQQASMGASGTPQMPTDRPINPIEAYQLRQQGANLENMWVIHPSGEAIWNPGMRKWTPYKESLYKDSAGGGNGSMGTRGLEYLQGLYGSVQQQGLTPGGPGILGLGRLAGLKADVASRTQSSPEAATYENIKAAFGTALARAGGEKGTMTDKDRKVVLDALPTFYDSPEVARQKWAGFETLLGLMEQKYGMSSGELSTLLLGGNQ